MLFEGDDFFCEVDNGEFLFLADVKLLDEFLVDFHEFVLKDGNLVFVLRDAAAWRFGVGVGFESLGGGGSKH